MAERAFDVRVRTKSDSFGLIVIRGIYECVSVNLLAMPRTETVRTFGKAEAGQLEKELCNRVVSD